MAVLPPDEYKKKMQAQEKEAFAILEAQTKVCMTDKSMFLDLLNKIADHTTTSVANTILAQAQKPDATAVTSMSEWQNRNIEIIVNENGYRPKGIYQFAPDGYFVDEETGEARPKFKVFKGYDASQTTNPEYAKQVMQNTKPINIFVGETADKAKNIGLCNSSPIRVLSWAPNKLIDEKENISESVGVLYVPETKTVIIRAIARNEFFLRLSYEIAHGMLHKELGRAYNRHMHSFEAGIIAYMLCRSAGVETDGFYFNDFQNVVKKYPNNKLFRDMLEHCYEISHELAFRLNNKLKENNNKAMKQQSEKEVVSIS